ncbi:integral membrane protein, PqiA family [compost metagenome]
MPDSVDAKELSEIPLENLVACHECDLLMRKPELAYGEKAVCPRCGYELYANRYNVVQRSLALVIAALLLFIPANFLPIMQLNLLGQSSQDTVWSGVVALFDTGMQSVSVIVFLCSMGIPLLKLLCQLTVLLSIRFDVGRSYGLLLYRIYPYTRMGDARGLLHGRTGSDRKTGRYGSHHRRPRPGVLHWFVADSSLAGGRNVSTPDLASVIRRGCPCGRLMRAF